MEFRRIEVRKIVRHFEHVDDAAELRKIFEALHSKGLSFSVKLSNMGSILRECIVTSVGAEDQVSLYARFPQKVRVSPKYDEIEKLEVECGSDFVSEYDNGGRWAMVFG